MRKAVLIFALFIFSITCCLADYTKYYEFDENLNVKFIPSVSAKDKEYFLSAYNIDKSKVYAEG